LVPFIPKIRELIPVLGCDPPGSNTVNHWDGCLLFGWTWCTHLQRRCDGSWRSQQFLPKSW